MADTTFLIYTNLQVILFLLTCLLTCLPGCYLNTLRNCQIVWCWAAVQIHIITVSKKNENNCVKLVLMNLLFR